MAVSFGNSHLQSPLCRCYRVASLKETILGGKETSNLHDRYVLGEQLGLGQFGVIRECVDKVSGEVLACKSISKDRLVTQEDAHSIKLEIEIMTRLSGHPNVVDLKAVYEEEDYVHLIMELCAGGELFHKLEKYGKFSESEARVLFTHLMQVVAYCHENGVVHRDLKPENILLATKSSSSPIKLADFGLATYISPGQSLNGIVGSPFYIAPEVLSGSYDQAADVWSAGVILYILLSGMPPFWGNTKSCIFEAVRAVDLRFPYNVWDFVSESAKDLIQGMLCRDTSKRPSAHQVLEHPWVKNTIPFSIDPLRVQDQNLRLVSDKRCSPSSLMSRSQDISFGLGTPIISDVQSLCFTCKSSFSSFPSISLSASASQETIGFTFHGTNTLELSTPVIALPSFAFFGSNHVAEQEKESPDTNCDSSRTRLILSASNDFGLKVDELLKVGSGNVPRRAGIQSRRNHTISLGESEHIDLVVTESVIRWASCTNLPTTTSLRLSLVC